VPTPASKTPPASPVAAKQELSTNRVILLSAGITFVVLVGSAVFARSLALQLILDGKVLSKKTAADNTLAKNLETVPQLQNNYNDLGQNSTLVLNALPAGSDFSLVSSLMESLTSQSGLQLRSVTPAVVTTTATGAAAPAPAAGNGPQNFSFSISVGGPYAGLVQFLSNLEHSARPVRVTDITVTGTGASLNADIQLVTYVQDKADLKPKLETIK
jgi:Pilus assembly protein, PilO